MPFKWNKDDIRLLRNIAEHRVLTLDQLTVLSQRNSKSISRRLAQLREAGFIQTNSLGFGHSPGRPVNLVSLTEEGLHFLSDKGLLSSLIRGNLITSSTSHDLNHQILVNWFQIHLLEIERHVPSLTVQFLAPTSPFLDRDSKGHPLVFDKVPPKEDGGKWIEFVPDGVFSITSMEIKKTLLFFLEVDMGTESLGGAGRSTNVICQKVKNYQDYFRSRQYKRYEQVWNCELNGFRLLFLTNTHARKLQLCRFVQMMKPSEFVWISDQDQMFTNGLGAEIWARGGKNQSPPQSILGSKSAHLAPGPVV